MFRVRIHEGAAADADAAKHWYKIKQSGLDHDFAVEVRIVLNKILLDPESWPMCGLNVHSCSFQRFPDRMIFSVFQDELRIVAIAHNSRRPGYWRKRKFA